MDEPSRVCSKCGECYSGDVIFCPKDGTPLGAKKTEIVDDPYLGLTLADQFRIEQFVGIGSMGRVYRAHQRGIERDVAVKILHRELMINDQLISRFHREAKVASRLVHPNVVQVLMTGEIAHSEGATMGGETYLVMEYLNGISLRSALAAAGGALPLPRALHVMLQVCDAVGEAHAQGIVHRDLKPENVMLVRRGDDDDFVKVLDFGVARIDWADSTVATQTGVIFGTARYISPEGAEGTAVTAQSDVYSAATMLFQCLAGRTPFDGDNPVGILVKQTTEPAPDVRSIARASYVPEPIARVITANLAKKPADRCRDARELGRAIVQAADASGLSADDLVLRSTLLGGVRGALQLASLQRTKSLGLTPELAKKMAGGTRMVERGTPVPTSPPATGPGGPATPTSPRVDPTLADEPVSSGLPQPARTSSPPASARPGGPSSQSPSYPADTLAPPATSGARIRRAMIVGACFATGAALSVLIARSYGVFSDRGTLTVETYEQRARAAVAASAWDSPPGENVRDITDAALQRWPRAPGILAIRRKAAERIARSAREAGRSDAEEAIRLARLALDLDPDNGPARRVLHATSGRVATDGNARSRASEGSRPQKPSGRATRARSVTQPPDAGSTPRSADAGREAATAPVLPGGGRWL